MKPSVFEPPTFEAPEDAPTRTKDGEPWTRWGHAGNYEGWYAIGSRPVEDVMEKGRPSFWEATFYAACQWTGGNLDQAHCCGPGILSLGGLGVTLKSGFAQVLLHQCLLTDPERYLQTMAPVLYATGVYTKRTDKVDAGIALVDSKGKRIDTEKRIRDAVTLGSDGTKWNDRQKKRAQVWVTCCSKLLRDARMDAAQAAFAEHVLPALLTAATREMLCWPRRNGMRDSWQYTQEQQALWATALIMGLEDAEHTETVLRGCVVGEGRFPDAEASLGNVHTYAWEGDAPGRYGERLRRVLLDVARQFRIENISTMGST